MRVHRLWRSLSAPVVAALLAACGGLPGTGPVLEGDQVGEPNTEVRVIPEGPRLGANQEDVVRGFLRVMSLYDPDRSVAKSYVSPATAGNWPAAAPVTVVDSLESVQIQRVDATTVELSATKTGSIDHQGRYAASPVGQMVTARIPMVQIAGQWRVTLPAEGFSLWIGQDDLAGAFRPYAVAYVAPTGRTLVPDVRWLANGTNVATTLARLVLEPVPSHLRGAVLAAAPGPLRLRIDAVPARAGTATVDLDNSLASATDDQRRALLARFVATLTQAPSIEAVRLDVEGTALDVAGVQGGLAHTPNELGYGYPVRLDPVTVLLRTRAAVQRVNPMVGGKVQEATSGGADGVPSGPGAAVPSVDIPVGWINLAWSHDESTVAAIGGDRKELAFWRGAKMSRLESFGTGLTRPSFDIEGMAWVAGLDGAGSARVWVVNTSRLDEPVAMPVTANWLGGRIVDALKVSPDGTRVAVISRDAKGGSARVDIAGVTRSPNGVATSLAEPRQEAGSLTLATDVVWLDDRTMAVLGRANEKDPLRPVIAPLGRPIEVLSSGPPGRAVAITTVRGERGLVVMTEGNAIYERVGNDWQQLAVGSDLLAPGR